MNSKGLQRFARRLWKYRGIYLMLLIPLAFFVTLKYLPLWNSQIAFKAFSPQDGVMGSKWLPFNETFTEDEIWNLEDSESPSDKALALALNALPYDKEGAEGEARTKTINFFSNFTSFFDSPKFWELIRNTLFYSFGKLIIGLPLAILLALALHESARRGLRKIVQTLAYLPHFLSWIIMLGLIMGILSQSDGMVNDVIKSTGGETIDFLGSPQWFPFVILMTDAWKETGWTAIIFLAALLGIDPALYEAADVEGASRFQKIWRITLPGILDVIVIVLLLKLGNILNAGFHQLYVLYSPTVYPVADIIDTWVYRTGVLDYRFSLATAVGLFKGVIGFLMLFLSNRIARRFAGSSLY